MGFRFSKPASGTDRASIGRFLNEVVFDKDCGATRMTIGRHQSATAVLQLYILGPFQLCDGSNHPITLRNRKAQALLALLAMAPRGERTRVWLRDKLWSHSDEHRSSNNLRQTLFEIRRDLGPIADRALNFGGQTISFKPGRFWIDHAAILENPVEFTRLGLTAETELLEGFDIGDPEFEDWLSLERGNWADRAEVLGDQPSLPAILSFGDTTPANRPAHSQTSLALMRSVLHGSDQLGVHLADRVMEGIAGSLKELQPVRILDLRDHSGSIEDLAASASTEFYCRLRLLRIGDSVTLTLFLHRVSQMAMEWSQSIQCRLDDLIAYDGQVLQGFISQSVDRLARTLIDAIPAEDTQSDMRRSGYTALNLIFRLDETALEHALEILRPGDSLQSGLHAALRAYAASVRVGDNIGHLTDAARAALRRESIEEMSGNPFNSVALACCGHVLGYVLQEHEAAGQLLERAVRLNPAQAFAWDHYALHKMYTGDYSAARAAAERAVSLGASSPFSYSYQTTLAMTATLAGDYDRAIMAGRSALQKQPRYNPALRYLMVAHSARGERDKAEALRDRLLLNDPNFRDEEVQKLRFGRRVIETAAPVQFHLRKLFNE